MSSSVAADDDESPVRNSSRRIRRQRPPDARLQIFVFALLGVGVLAPWNAFISAKEYFDSRLLCSSHQTNNTTAAGDGGNGNDDGNIETMFAIWYNLSSVISMGAILTFQWVRDYFSSSTCTQPPPRNSTTTTATTEEEVEDLSSGDGLADDVIDDENESNKATGSPYAMVMIPIGVTLAVFLGQSVLVVMTNVRPYPFKVLTLVSLSLSGICSSIATAGVVATAGLFAADRAMNPFLAGQSVSGVLISLASFFAAAWEDPSTYWNANCETSSVDEANNNIIAATTPTPTSSTTTTSATATIMISRRESLYYEQAWLYLENDDGTCTPYDSVDWATFVYFLLGSLTLIGCLFGYAYIDRTPCEAHNEYETVVVVEEAEALRRSENPVNDESDSSPRIGLEMNAAPVDAREEEPRAKCNLVAKGLTDSLDSPESPREEEVVEVSTVPHESTNETVEVLSKIRGPATAVYLAFFVTLSLFPGLTSNLKSTRQCTTKFRLINDLYTPFTFLLFNTGDLTGRLLSAKLPLSRIAHLSNKLVVTAILRFLFFPLLFLCVSAGGSNTASRVQIPSDLYSVVVQFLFAVSNGCLVSTAFAHAPTLLHSTAHEQERMSEILTFSLVFGLLSGSLFSWPVSKLAS